MAVFVGKAFIIGLENAAGDVPDFFPDVLYDMEVMVIEGGVSQDFVQFVPMVRWYHSIL